MNGVSVTADFSNVMASLDNLVMKTPGAMGATNLAVAEEVFRLTEYEVPHDEGTLQNSGAVEEMPDGSAILGYHTPYAARLHEHPEYHFQKGRKGKYIEDPINHNAGILGLEFKRNVQTRLF